MANDTFEEDTMSVADRLAAEALIVDVDGFEGPLDLLLTLSRTQKVDLRKISVLQLAHQYLAFVEKAKALRLELAADYLVMAAWRARLYWRVGRPMRSPALLVAASMAVMRAPCSLATPSRDRKSTRLNSSHTVTPYAVFCLKKKIRAHALQ